MIQERQMHILARITLLAGLLLVAPPHVQAAEWGVLPIPRESGTWDLNDYINSLKMVKAIGAPVQVSVNAWSEMEPRKGHFEIDQHLGGLAYGANTIGLTPYFGINVINTTRRDMPADLMETSWTDPVMITRFEALLDATLEKVPASLPYMIIGNEVDVYLEKHPDEIEPFLAFYAKASAAARLRYPQAKIGITVTYEGLTKPERSDIVKRMIAVSDAAFFTFYPVFDLKALPLEQTEGRLDEMLIAAGTKDVILQELGFPSSPVIGVSEAMQANFFARVIPAIEARPRIKMASIFLLHDLDPKLCGSFVGYYGFGSAPDDLVAKFSAFLCSLGVRHLDGSLKPAWGVISHLISSR